MNLACRVLFASVLLGIPFNSAVGAEAEYAGLKLDFPEVPGFLRTGPKLVGKPTYGYVVSYLDERQVGVAIAVYNSTDKPIPDGLTSSAVVEEFERIEKGLSEKTELDAKLHYRLSESGEKPIGGSQGPLFRWRLYEVEYAHGVVPIRGQYHGVSAAQVYLTGYRGHFIRVQVYYPAGKNEKADQAATKVFEAVSKLLES